MIFERKWLASCTFKFISFLLHAFSLLTSNRKSTLFISSSLEFYEANLLFLQNFIKNFARHYNSAIKCKDKVLDHPMEQSNEIKNLNRLLEKWLFKLHTAKPMMGNYFWITYSKKHRPPFSPKFNLSTWFIYSIDKADWGIQLCWPIRAIRESLILNFGFSQINSVTPNPAYR